ncbi:MAG: adenylate/guanylate cyclase domain-containing protein [Lachnospiraceae bacterium]|nr:adenylate/guanylate cyclase domain-containing protein [Lachnospiraceae bacterium]
MNKKTRNQILNAFILSFVIVVITYAGALYRLDGWVQDARFQSPRALSGKVVIIGIDEEALAVYGPYRTWDRNIMASALEALGQDRQQLPAAVAIDTLYAGTTEADADERFAAAAKELGCVITADAASFGSGSALTESGTYTFDDYKIMGFEEPYEKLRNVTSQGHINAMYDTDGILRHAILYLDVPERGRVYSMAYMAATAYAEKNGFSVQEPETDSRGRFYVSYSSVPGGFYEGISIVDLINGQCPPDYYAGKIVLIGPYAVGLQDSVYTPIDRARQMYGVEYQANVIEAFLNGDYKTESSDLWQAVLLFAVCFGMLLLVQRIRLIYSSLICAAVVVVSFVVSGLVYNAGYIVHPLWIPFGILVVYIVSIGARYIRELAEKHRVTQTFERYVAPEIVKEILNEGTDALALGGKLCDIAVLFVDIRGFTTMSERLSPELVVSILNRYLGMTSECIARNKGTLDKFVGDATMAFWGAPVPQDDAVYLAVKTAMEIVEGAKTVSEEMKESIGEELRVGVGVHYGPAVVGNIGAKRHMDYTAIGDTVNTSARLEANAPGGTVYISRAVAQALEGRIKVTSLGSSVKLKGKSDGFEVLKVDALL